MTRPQTPVTLILHGAAGRMGQALLRAAPALRGVSIGAALVRPGSDLVDTSARAIAGPQAPDLDFQAALDPELRADALIDFSSPPAFDAALALALQRRIAFVSGTTGLSDTQHAALAHAAHTIPVLWASNFSLGIALMARFARMAAKALGDWDCEIIEMHHRRKADAPSGTAITLGKAVAQGRGCALDAQAVHGRQGLVGARPPGQIGFHAVRGGDVVGEHTVLFASDDERIELTHRASDRDVFARGALVAAQRLAHAPPRLYAMDDVIGDCA